MLEIPSVFMTNIRRTRQMLEEAGMQEQAKKLGEVMKHLTTPSKERARKQKKIGAGIVRALDFTRRDPTGLVRVEDMKNAGISPTTIGWLIKNGYAVATYVRAKDGVPVVIQMTGKRD